MATVDDALAYQRQAIQNFSANMPVYQQQQDSAITDNALSNIAQDNAQITNNYNDRGLSYSGLKDQSSADAAATESGKAAGAIQQANTNLNDQNYQNQIGGITSQLSNYNGEQQAKISSEAASNANQAQSQGLLANIGSGLLSAGTALALKSDKNAKKNISSSDHELGDFLDKVDNKKYDYKDQKDGKGKQYGLLAQDLEKHPVGKAMVIEADDGKHVDMAKGLASILAAQSYLHKRLKSVEQKDSA